MFEGINYLTKESAYDKILDSQVKFTKGKDKERWVRFQGPDKSVVDLELWSDFCMDGKDAFNRLVVPLGFPIPSLFKTSRTSPDPAVTARFLNLGFGLVGARRGV